MHSSSILEAVAAAGDGFDDDDVACRHVASRHSVHQPSDALDPVICVILICSCLGMLPVLQGWSAVLSCVVKCDVDNAVPL